MDLFGCLNVFLCLSFLVVPLTACNTPPPNVKHSSSNSTGTQIYANGTVIQYTCNYGYQGVGNNTIQCIDNSWVGQYDCFVQCDFFYELENGKIVNQPSYLVGSRITFTCNTGYAMVGEASLVCRADRKWRPSQPPRCEAVNCGDFGSIANGDTYQQNLDGNINVYGKVVEVRCDDGYVLNGSPTVTCQADGTWGQKPTCDLSDCGSHPALTSSCIFDSVLEAVILTVVCKETSDNVSVTEIGNGVAICSDNQWDELDMACYCDCKIDADLNKVVLENVDGNSFLTHGRTLDWSCKTSFIKESTNTISCNDGKAGVPKCVPIPTTRPPTTTTRLPTTITRLPVISTKQASVPTQDSGDSDDRATQSTRKLDDNKTREPELKTLHNGNEGMSRRSTIGLSVAGVICVFSVMGFNLFV